MNLQTVEIPRAEARESYLDYRRQAKLEQNPVAKTELEEIARAFRIASHEELSLIALSPTITRGGHVTRTRVYGRHQLHYALPLLAAAPADARFVYCSGIRRSGRVDFSDSLRRRRDYRSGVVRLETAFELPQGYESGWEGVWEDWGAWMAMVPVVPPKQRPRPNANLSKYVVLFEVDRWTWDTAPPAPGDPALLKHVGGDIYAVVSTWNLSELERLMLAGRRP